MPNWTENQKKAIELENSNIIVSAGAGSGKTAVLTARVIRKLKSGVDINKLLVLTFTKNAAAEMKNRIRDAIKKDENLKDQLDLLESSYITTFDSFAFSIVKKYHYVLNISNKLEIGDENVINLKKKDFLDEIFEELYLIRDTKFIDMINKFCIKDDNNIRDFILNTYNKLELKYDLNNYLDNYMGCYFDNEYIDSLFDEYERMIFEKLNNFKDSLRKLYLLCDVKYNQKIEELFEQTFLTKSYQDLRNVLPSSLPNLPKNSEEEVKKVKEGIQKELKGLNELVSFSKEDNIFNYNSTNYVSCLIEIIKKLDNKIINFKKENNIYSFNDISKMAIDVVSLNKNIANEIKIYFNEIMIDEYQDTNDLQDLFISFIENNNVYVVGDIKQSIYRFRNANPNLFKTKYDNYSKGLGGKKIDLLDNFRSRNEVVSSINTIFKYIMDDFIGGAEYGVSHQMNFGNKIYNEEINNQNNNLLEIRNYNFDKKQGFSKEEIEIFAIARDIKEKLDKKYKVFDKDMGGMREASYNDFCIILDRYSDFDKYKNIFEYLGIPMALYKKETLNDSVDVLLIQNILKLIILLKQRNFGVLFKNKFLSVARSFLFSYSDQRILGIFNDNSFYDDDIYKICFEISKKLDNLNNVDLLNEVIQKFEIYKKYISVGNIDNLIIQIEYLQKLAVSMSKIGYSPYKFCGFLDEIILNGDLRYDLDPGNVDGVKLMSIHGSKGLEFSVCYFAGFYKGFNVKDIQSNFLFDNKYGFVLPYFNEGEDKTFVKELVKRQYIIDDISERIRLFYVAVTRCREKLIVLADLDDEYNINRGIVNDEYRLKYKSFLDILNSVRGNLDEFVKDLNIDDLGLTKNYLVSQNDNDFKSLKTDCKKISKKSNDIDYKEVVESNFSKNSNKLISKEAFKNMEYGIYLHYLFEVSDFKDKDLPEVVNNFLKHEEVNEINNCKIYKEYEFLYTEGSIKYHGIIDLMFEADDYIKIVDYKLKNIVDDAYKKQLNGYKKYIEKKFNKKVYIYLYSVLDDNFLQL